MEAAGLTIGTLSLASLFSSAIECMEYVDLARNFAQDYEIALVKFLLLKGRLNAWGKSLQVYSPGNEHAALRRHWNGVQNTVQKALEAICHMFGDVDNLQKRYGLRSTEISRSSDLRTFEAASPSEAVGQVAIAFRFRSLAQTRQRNTSITKKIARVIQDRKKFDSLLADLSDLIGSLEKLSESLGAYGSLAQFFQDLVQKVSTPEGRELITEASRILDDGSPPQSSSQQVLLASQALNLPPPPPPPSSSRPQHYPVLTDHSTNPMEMETEMGPNRRAGDQPTTSTSSLQNIDGDLFLNCHVKDWAKGFIGSVGDGGEMRHSYPRATFEHNTIEGHAKGGIGRLSNAAATSLWNSWRRLSVLCDDNNSTFH